MTPATRTQTALIVAAAAIVLLLTALTMLAPTTTPSRLEHEPAATPEGDTP